MQGSPRAADFGKGGRVVGESHWGIREWDGQMDIAHGKVICFDGIDAAMF